MKTEITCNQHTALDPMSRATDNADIASVSLNEMTRLVFGEVKD